MYDFGETCMNIVGIVAEYNPFHNGHKYQIDKIKELYPNSLIVVCMSSSFTQRGNISILNKFDKTEIAIKYGADLVVELPYVYSTSSADIFASKAIQLLNNCNIDILSFGSESADIDLLKEIACVQINNKSFDEKVKNNMNVGLNYPTAVNKAIKHFTKKEINNPNDLLAISYLKEIMANDGPEYALIIEFYSKSFPKRKYRIGVCVRGEPLIEKIK